MTALGRCQRLGDASRVAHQSSSVTPTRVASDHRPRRRRRSWSRRWSRGHGGRSTKASSTRRGRGRRHAIAAVPAHGGYRVSAVSPALWGTGALGDRRARDSRLARRMTALNRRSRAAQFDVAELESFASGRRSRPIIAAPMPVAPTSRLIARCRLPAVQYPCRCQCRCRSRCPGPSRTRARRVAAARPGTLVALPRPVPVPVAVALPRPVVPPLPVPAIAKAVAVAIHLPRPVVTFRIARPAPPLPLPLLPLPNPRCVAEPVVAVAEPVVAVPEPVVAVAESVVAVPNPLLPFPNPLLPFPNPRHCRRHLPEGYRTHSRMRCRRHCRTRFSRCCRCRCFRYRSRCCVAVVPVAGALPNAFPKPLVRRCLPWRRAGRAGRHQGIDPRIRESPSTRTSASTRASTRASASIRASSRLMHPHRIEPRIGGYILLGTRIRLVALASGVGIDLGST